MKAAVYKKFGSPDVLEIMDRPEPVAVADELLVKVEAAALNPKDVLLRKGKMRMMNARGWPKPVGHDAAGVVKSVGPAAAGFAVGDRVFGMVNGNRLATCAEYCLLRAGETAKMPEAMGFVTAAAIPLAAQTALQALRDCGGLMKGQRVLINGASGGVGTFAVQIAKAMGAYVIAVSSERNRQLVEDLGADEWLDYSAGDILRMKPPVHILFDAFGNKSFSQARPALLDQGIYVTTVPGPGAVVGHLATRFSRNKRCRLVVVKSKTDNLQWLASQFEAGKLKAVIDSEWPLESIAEAETKMETRRARGKLVVLP